MPQTLVRGDVSGVGLNGAARPRWRGFIDLRDSTGVSRSSFGMRTSLERCVPSRVRVPGGEGTSRRWLKTLKSPRAQLRLMSDEVGVLSEAAPLPFRRGQVHRSG